MQSGIRRRRWSDPGRFAADRVVNVSGGVVRVHCWLSGRCQRRGGMIPRPQDGQCRIDRAPGPSMRLGASPNSIVQEGYGRLRRRRRVGPIRQRIKPMSSLGNASARATRLCIPACYVRWHRLISPIPVPNSDHCKFCVVAIVSSTAGQPFRRKMHVVHRRWRKMARFSQPMSCPPYRTTSVGVLQSLRAHFGMSQSLVKYVGPLCARTHVANVNIFLCIPGSLNSSSAISVSTVAVVLVPYPVPRQSWSAGRKRCLFADRRSRASGRSSRYPSMRPVNKRIPSPPPQ